MNRRNFNLSAGVGALTAMSSTTVKAASQPTLSLNVVYPNHEGAKFDMNYYRDTHIPLAMKVMKADSVLLIEGVPNGDVPPPFVMICHFEFASAEALKASSTAPGIEGVRADVAKFTDIKPMIMMGKSL